MVLQADTTLEEFAKWAVNDPRWQVQGWALSYFLLSFLELYRIGGCSGTSNTQLPGWYMLM